MDLRAEQFSEAATVTLTPIGYVRRDEAETATDGPELRANPSRIVLDPQFVDGLLGLEPGSDVLVLCYFHRADRDVLQVHPRGDLTRSMRGVFATRSPVRPNPISVTSARIQRIDRNELHVIGLDAVDGTPVVDIKSYAEAFDTPYTG